MTSKEKAKELVSKFNFEHIGDTYILHQTLDESKRCALIAVDEILNAITFNMYDEESYNIEDKYWQEVKKEIELL